MAAPQPNPSVKISRETRTTIVVPSEEIENILRKHFGAPSHAEVTFSIDGSDDYATLADARIVTVTMDKPS